ncbi:hypothetical protein HUX88_11445 [Duganella sp. BJB1802]|nr:hypothetical protein [Duganella sp. BJB1802]
MIFPVELDWATVPDEVLVELVETYFMEMSCATVAVVLLARRKHARALALVRWLIDAPNVDVYLMEAAKNAIAIIEESDG